jgi:hypothetical protein
MRLYGRATAAAALAVSLSCGSLPPTGTSGAAAEPPPPLVPATTGTAGIAAPEPQLQSTASLGGIVVHAGTREPVARARVTAASPALAEPRVSISAGDGRFEFRNLPAGAY